MNRLMLSIPSNLRLLIPALCVGILLTSCDQLNSPNEGQTPTGQTEEEDWLTGLAELGNQALDKGGQLAESFAKKVSDIQINGFSLEDDKKMGKQLYDEVINSGQYKVMDRNEYKDLYAYVEGIKMKILNSGQLEHRKAFEWKLTLINDDETINAFCAPGGYIFVYTGILKYLEDESQLAGVLAHEIGHADRRHGSRQLTKSVGIEMILGFLLDNQNATEITAGLLNLSYSRRYEREADECSVKYLCGMDYNAAGGAGFFRKIVKENGSSGSTDLLSTHPNPEERIANFNELKAEYKCSGKQQHKARFLAMQRKLK
jgi:predicted Zn-dependent protease